MPNETAMTSFQDSDVVITGGLGFIGSSLAHELVSLGANVTLYDAMLEPYGSNLYNIHDIREKVNVVKGDIREGNKVYEVINGVDYVFHCAAQVSRILSMENPMLDIDINCKGTINIIEAIRKSGSPKLIYIGSRAQIGEPTYLPVNENHPEMPLNIYGANKLAAELYCMIYHRVYGLPVTSVRLSNVYGPRAQIKTPHYGVINWFVGLAIRGEQIPVFGDGSQTRDYVFINDIVEAIILAAFKNSDGEIYMIGSGRGISIIHIVREIIKTTGTGSYKHVPFPIDWKRIDMGRYISDVSKAREHLGWIPKTPLKEGLSRTVSYYKKNLEHYIQLK